jgi:hypothetical protein
MGRPATGQVVVEKRRRGLTFALRFHAYGKRQYVTLGTATEGWTRTDAHEELENILPTCAAESGSRPSHSPHPR